MSANSIKLVNFKVDSFAKIDKSNPVIIVWPTDEQKNISLFKGDQAVGKTSALSAFAAACGLPLIENAINKVDNDRKVSFEFVRQDRTYKVVITKTRFEIETLIGDKWAKMASPKTVLQDALGPVGQSPMFLKEYSGAEQISWLRSFYQLTEEQVNQEKVIDDNIKKAYTTRRDLKRKVADLDKKISSNEYYNNRLEWDKKIKEFNESDQDKISNIQTRHTHYTSVVAGLESMKNTTKNIEAQKLEIEEEILDLEKRLEAKRKQLQEKETELVNLKERVKAGDKYVEDNKFIVDEYNQIESIVKLKADMATHIANYKQMEELVQEKTTAEKEYEDANTTLEKNRKEKIAFIKTIIQLHIVFNFKKIFCVFNSCCHYIPRPLSNKIFHFIFRHVGMRSHLHR